MMKMRRDAQSPNNGSDPEAAAYKANARNETG
jgi:hypothetical protein